MLGNIVLLNISGGKTFKFQEQFWENFVSRFGDTIWTQHCVTCVTGTNQAQPTTGIFFLLKIGG